MTIKIKRAYEPATKDDGYRILCDRFWPRGLTKVKAKIHQWIKELAPTKDLIEWFHVDPENRWKAFLKKYKKELKPYKVILKHLQTFSKYHTLTIIYSTKNEEYNNAVALKMIIEKIK